MAWSHPYRAKGRNAIAVPLNKGELSSLMGRIPRFATYYTDGRFGHEGCPLEGVFGVGSMSELVLASLSPKTLSRAAE